MPFRSSLVALVLCLCSALCAQETPHVHTSRSGARLLPLPKEEGVWHFIIFGDRTAGPAEGLKILAEAVEDTNLLDPDLIMTVGDLIPGYTDRERWLRQMTEYTTVMKGLKRPWYPVAGNHDIYFRGPNPPKDGHETAFEAHFGPLWYWFPHKNSAFVVLYSDEGDLKTGEKGFGDPRFNEFSPAQLSWLEATLKSTATLEHVFVFVHHPRWIVESYPNSNWALVHSLLKGAGNVRAVFAGHIHRMRYDGAKDGIEYFTLGSTGGSIPATVPEAGWLHHFDLVTVRKAGISVASLPVGAVIDPKTITPERFVAVDLLVKHPLPKLLGGFSFRMDGTADGSFTLTLENPTAHPVEFTIEPETRRARAFFSPDHVHRALAPNSRESVTFAYRRHEKDDGKNLVEPDINIQRALHLPDVRITLPEQRLSLPLMIEGELPVIASGDNGVLSLDGSSSLRLSHWKLDIPKGPFTVEAWVRLKSLRGRQPIVSKAESSEWGLFLNDGVPSFIVHLNGKYETVKGTTSLASDTWHHLAGAYDGGALNLYVNGLSVARTEAQGTRTTNSLPIYIGADPNRTGLPGDFLQGLIDDVRISKVARSYNDELRPARPAKVDAETLVLLPCDQVFGPLFPDASPQRVHATGIGTPTTVLERDAN